MHGPYKRTLIKHWRPDPLLFVRMIKKGKCKSGAFRMVGCQLGPHQRAHSGHDLGDRYYWLNPDPSHLGPFGVEVDLPNISTATSHYGVAIVIFRGKKPSHATTSLKLMAASNSRM